MKSMCNGCILDNRSTNEWMNRLSNDLQHRSKNNYWWCCMEYHRLFLRYPFVYWIQSAIDRAWSPVLEKLSSRFYSDFHFHNHHPMINNEQDHCQCPREERQQVHENEEEHDPSHRVPNQLDKERKKRRWVHVENDGFYPFHRHHNRERENHLDLWKIAIWRRTEWMRSNWRRKNNLPWHWTIFCQIKNLTRIQEKLKFSQNSTMIFARLVSLIRNSSCAITFHLVCHLISN